MGTRMIFEFTCDHPAGCSAVAHYPTGAYARGSGWQKQQSVDGHVLWYCPAHRQQEQPQDDR